MKCNKVRRALSRLIDQDLGQSEKVMIEQHLADCAACRAELEALQADAELLRLADSPEPPPYLVARTMAEIRAEVKVSRPFWARAIPVAAAVLLAAVGAWCGAILGREFAGSRNGYTESVLAVNSEPSLYDVYQTAVEER
ncbi:MAG: zf-HC2 domain-containing protein [candidate division WOR-3 bacterium]